MQRKKIDVLKKERKIESGLSTSVSFGDTSVRPTKKLFNEFYIERIQQFRNGVSRTIFTAQLYFSF